MEGVKCVPSAERPSPGKLGYYIGGHTGTDSTLIKKKNRIFPIYEEIQKGSVAKSYMTNGLLIYG